MARLPIPGKDSGQWGTILNDYLSQAHDTDGAIKPNSISEAKLDVATRTKLNTAASGIADGAVTTQKIADNAVTSTKLDTATQANLTKASTAVQPADITGKADDASVLHKAGVETVTGAKNFTGGLTLNGTAPALTNDTRLTDTRTPTDNSVTVAKLAPNTISAAGLSGSYADLTNKPTIPATAAQVGAEPVGLSSATQATLNSMYAAASSTLIALSASRPRLPISPRALVPNNPFGTGASANLSNGTDVSATYRRYLPFVAAGENFTFKWGNYINNGGFEANGPNDITIRASVEKVDGTLTPIYFNGSRTKTISPGGTAESDPIGLRIFKGASAGIYIRTYVTVASGGKWPLGYLEQHGFGDMNNRAVSQSTAIGADMTDSGTFATFTDEMSFGPLGVYAQVVRPPAVIIGAIADSIVAGYGDLAAYQGWFVRGLGDNYLYQGVAMSSGKIDDWTTPAKNWRRSPLLSPCTDILVALGANNIGASLTVNQPLLQAIYDRFAGMGKRVWVSTVTPNSYSTDGYLTTANQTPGHTGNSGDATMEANRVALNTWLRSKPNNVYGVIDPADAVETARNSGIWKADGTSAGRYTQDGQHPNAVGSAAAATCFSAVALFGPPTT